MKYTLLLYTKRGCYKGLSSLQKKLVQIDNFGSVDAVSAFRVGYSIISVHMIETGETTR